VGHSAPHNFLLVDNLLMAMFVHLTTESRVPFISKGGIARLREIPALQIRGVYAVPVTPDFYASHQWLRELKRKNRGPVAGVYFRVPDEQSVWMGHYGKSHRLITAAEAVGEFTRAEDPIGWEVIVPRRIEADEIHRVRQLSQIIGWRFSPDSKGKPPFCTCKFCTRGEYGSARLRERFGSPDKAD
jgi:hypothetical protein